MEQYRGATLLRMQMRALRGTNIPPTPSRRSPRRAILVELSRAPSVIHMHSPVCDPASSAPDSLCAHLRAFLHFNGLACEIGCIIHYGGGVVKRNFDGKKRIECRVWRVEFGVWSSWIASARQFLFLRACRPQLAENSPLDCFPGARCPCCLFPQSPTPYSLFPTPYSPAIKAFSMWLTRPGVSSTTSKRTGASSMPFSCRYSAAVATMRARLAAVTASAGRP